MSCNNSTTEIEYPVTKKIDASSTYFGEKVADPYRWLEDDNSEATKNWVAQENKVTNHYLSKIPYRKKLKKRLEELWNYEKISAPVKEGAYTYYTKNDGLQNQNVYYRINPEGEEELFLDPNTFSKDGSTALMDVSFSKTHKYAAYSISEAGSDWRKVIIINAETKAQIEDTLVDIKFSGISWKGDEGFYYSSYDKPKGSALSAKTDQHKVYFHKIKTPQNEDAVIFGATPEEKHRYVGAYVSDDDAYLQITASTSTSGNKLYLKDLTQPNSALVPIIETTESDSYILDNDKSTLYIVTNLNAPNKKVITVDAKNPKPNNWNDFIPETEYVLNISKGAGYFFANYMVDALSKIKQYNYSGKMLREIELPGLGDASGFSGKKDTKELYYTFTNYTTPSNIYSYQPVSGKSTLYRASAAKFNSSNYTTKQVFYTSKDGTKIPMIITYKKGIELNGKNPTILYGYGGFNISLTPYFSVSRAVWLEQGGIYAVANLRGGGEYGKKWHDEGTQLKKQNVFDDFIAAAEYLKAEKFTSTNYLAIQGGSNGGLLVGATLTQRPDLVQVALPAVGVLDMLRYHTFTAGAGWAYDYGTAEDSEEMFQYLKKYSPVHNVKEGVSYPATLITTSDHDDRVVPAHSFKFAAELQSKQSGTNPVLIRIETNAGHGAGKALSKIIQEQADIYGFTLFNMGFEKLPNTNL